LIDKIKYLYENDAENLSYLLNYDIVQIKQDIAESLEIQINDIAVNISKKILNIIQENK
jgi:hypothetical protein